MKSIVILSFIALNLLIFTFSCLIAVVLNPLFFDSTPWLLIGFSVLINCSIFVFFCLISYVYPTLPGRYSSEPVTVTVKKTDWGIIFVSLIILIGLSIVSIDHRHRFSIDRLKLVVLGLDGATWDIIHPLFEENYLPNLMKLRQDGASGILKSEEPIRSPRVWTTMSTGRHADIHGIDGFFSSRLDLQCPRIWDICHQNGMNVGLFAWLVTWPPRDPFSFIIPSWMARTPETKPIEYSIYQELHLEQGLYGGTVSPLANLLKCIRLGMGNRALEQMAWFYWKDWRHLEERERLARKSFAEIRIQTDLFLSLARRYTPDVAAFTLYGSDKLAHRFWHDMDPGAFDPSRIQPEPKYKHIIRDYYIEADRAFGRILAAIPADCHVAVVSDHGMKADTAAPRQFFLDIPRFLRLTGWDELVHYTSIMSWIAFEPVVDDETLIRKLIEDIESIHFQDEQEPLFQVERDESGRILVRAGFSLSWHPESPLLTNEYIDIHGRLYRTDTLFFSRTFSADHDLDGVIFLAGPAIHPGRKIEGATLYDVAPTLLYLLDLPISRELEGAILTSAIREDYLNRRAPRLVDAYEPPAPLSPDGVEIDERYMEHLRSLGYTN